MPDSEPQPQSPYKFLDYYRKKDRDIFFGRKAETRVLLADVSVTRLVVLFAKTGTGKTSLINAGVRPLLEERGYATFFIRVKKDPIESARKAILEPDPDEGSPPEPPGDGRPPATPLEWSGKDFAACLENVADQLKQSIVLFFDQFEEFFIYPLDEAALPAAEAEAERLRDREQQLRRRQEFIENVARIYHDQDSRVHLVFSMREEWFVELDMFRDLIPKIFHNDSNLRLRWFSQSQARDAIRLPAQRFGIEVTDGVVERLIADLSDEETNEIEPAQLQIVCDTLWWSGEGDSITVDDYERLGRASGAAPHAGPSAAKESIARRILFMRLGKEFEKIEDDEQLYLLYALLPKLGTRRGTKYVRDIGGLIKELTSDDPALREAVPDDVARQALVEKLKRNENPLRDAGGLIRESASGDPAPGEAVADEAARVGPDGKPKQSDNPLGDLLVRLRDGIGLVRTGVRDNLEVVELAHDYLVGNLSDLQARVKVIPPRRTLERVTASGAELATPEEIEVVSDAASILAPTEEQAAKMLRSSVSRGLESYTKLWFGLAGEKRAWEVLGACLADIETASFVIRFLDDLGDPRAFDLLDGIMDKEEMSSISSFAIEVFSRRESPGVVDFLSGAARRPGLRREARAALRRVAETARDSALAERAAAALENVAAAAEPQDRPPDPGALTPHFKSVIKSLAEGRVIVFLGPDLNGAGHGGDGAWRPGRTLPSGEDLAAHLAEKFQYPSDKGDARDLARVSQYAAATTDEDRLYDVLRDVFRAEPDPSELHRLWPRLVSRGAGGGLILTTAYDDRLERAFAEEPAVPFDLLTYVARGPDAGKFLHVTPDGEKRLIEVPFEYRGLAGDRPIIIKVSGGIVRAGEEYDSFVITEDDYIEQLSLSDLISLLPLTLAARLRRSHFLFLGYSPRDWNARVLLQRLWGKQRSGYQSWAIQAGHDPIERALWHERGVEFFNVPLDRYAAELETHVKGREPETKGKDLS